ncbi:PREDICTED: uncharacterized protein LOC105961337 [Erythranthe guttata]|uniref:uncharacterized protein LOC105961337 n=1 Tax=Erythranthe guttata TaxID=4155 RepID=UPI00064D7DD4|nr:PREDICTED: uncharacterized protein LOC105961337 [Erythranthe guttata]|eukprot:XP_012841024.1 PREDICTED: uncharacterized protein LOC105961337 [Erythranthe guttata]
MFRNVLVAQNDSTNRATLHMNKITIVGATTVTEFAADMIPTLSFDFMSFSKVINGADESLLIDIIGHVIEKKPMKDVSKNGRKDNLMEVVLQNLEGNTLKCALWNNYVDDFESFLAKHDAQSPIIVILQLCQIKSFQVQIGAMNIQKNWPLYTIKSMHDEEELIRQFKAMYCIKESDEDESIENFVQHQDDSSNALSTSIDDNTPIIYLGEKRVDEGAISNLSHDDTTQMSSTTALKKIKIEKLSK